MIGFGCATTSDLKFRAEAAGAIERLAEHDSLLLRRHGSHAAMSSLCNDMLDRAAEQRDLEAFVVLAEDVSLEEDGFLAKVRRLLTAHEDIALIAVAGRGSRRPGPFDGHLLVFSPWAVGALRFDDALAVPFDCAVADLRQEARARGRRVVATAVHVSRPPLCTKLGDRGRLVRGAVAVRRKWATDGL